MKTLIHLTVIALVTSLAGCAAVRVEVTRDETYPISPAATYTWRAHPDLKTLGRLVSKDTDACIRSATETALAAKGMRSASKDTATLGLAYLVLVEDQFQPRLMESDWSDLQNRYDRDDDIPPVRSGFRYRNHDWEWTPRETETYTYPYEIGTLVFEFFDPSSGTSVWRGSIEAEIPRSEDHAKTCSRIRHAVDTLLMRFPGE